MGHDDLDFLISATVNRLAPDKVSAFDTAEVHAVLIGFSRLKPAKKKIDNSYTFNENVWKKGIINDAPNM